MRVALADNRRCFIMLFSTDVVRYELSGPEGIEQAIRFLSQRFRGGTDIASCFRAIIERMQGREWFDADAVVISDFIAQRLPDDVVSKVGELQRLHQHRFHAVAMSAHGKPASCAFSIISGALIPDAKPPAEMLAALTAYKIAGMLSRTCAGHTPHCT